MAAAADGQAVTLSPHARGWTGAGAQDTHLCAAFPARAGMDLGGSPAENRRLGFPRTRGDGPAAVALESTRWKLSPHARGWTHPDLHPPGADQAFPARAGMDRRGPHAESHPRRFPRTRGDGPVVHVLFQVDAELSPHARGWTAVTTAHRGDAPAFPARAGMDPACTSRRVSSTGFPRTRGDGPDDDGASVPLSRLSPHARGWTVIIHIFQFGLDAFPARAGMDPAHAARCRPDRGFPRTRGDGPGTLGWLDEGAQLSPHARGWTVLGCDGRPVRHAFPARAGMDPARAIGLLAGHGFPRTRGDGPRYRSIASLLAPLSPHARGWTVQRRHGGERHHAFPARAGMDPARAAGSGSGARFPRTRGDGPRRGPAWRNGAKLSPHARGWTRRAASQGPEWRASPHARGWTRCSPSAGDRAYAFPARAGMDPVARGSGRNATSFPRTRGDGPSQRSPATARWPLSPHARGWTLIRDVYSNADKAFPARAGMDPGPGRR